MEYCAHFEPAEEGGFVITFPDFGWGVSQGDGEDDARMMAPAGLQTMLQHLIRKGEEIPAPGVHRGRKFRSIELPALDSMKVELYLRFRASGMTKAELARQLGIPKTNVDRLFDLKRRTRLEQMEAAFRVLGKRIRIQVLDAA